MNSKKFFALVSLWFAVMFISSCVFDINEGDLYLTYNEEEKTSGGSTSDQAIDILSRVKVGQIKAKLGGVKKNKEWVGHGVSNAHYIDSKKFTSQNIGSSGLYTSHSMVEPIFVEDKLIILNGTGLLGAYDASSLQMVWNVSLDRDIQNGALSYSQGTIFIATDSSDVYGIEASSGKVLWTKHLKTVVRARPTVYKNYVYFYTIDDYLYAIDVENGRIKWVYQGAVSSTRRLSKFTVKVHDDVLYIPLSEGSIVALDYNTGEQLWENEISSEVSKIGSRDILSDLNFDLEVVSNKIVASTLDGVLYAFNKSSGNVEWRVNVAPIIEFKTFANFIFLLDRNYVLHAIDGKTGEIIWSVDANAYYSGKSILGLSIVNDSVWIFGRDGVIDSFNYKDGKYITSNNIRQTFWHIPVIALGKMYLYNGVSKIMVIGG